MVGAASGQRNLGARLPSIRMFIRAETHLSSVRDVRLCVNAAARQSCCPAIHTITIPFDIYFLYSFRYLSKEPYSDRCDIYEVCVV